MSNELASRETKPAVPQDSGSTHAVLYAFLKDGHYNHSPQFHPIGAGSLLRKALFLSAASLWSAVTCHRFGRLRPVAAFGNLNSPGEMRRQAAAGKSADRSALQRKASYETF
ncbi:MAG TPA: hypothetical protein VGN90_14065 [Pyrinomonadaceae bacterium]|nr:hypothetical protein [Pyrinomonadaceae bacterium]